MLQTRKMNKKLPEWTWVIILVLPAVIFFWKIFIKDELPIPADITTGVYYPWLNQKWGYPAGVPVKNPLLTDAISLIYPWRIHAIRSLKDGIFPFWNNTIFSGTPLFANFQSGVINPANLAFLFLSEPKAWAMGVVGQSLVALVTMFYLLRYWKRSHLASVFGSISYAFSGFALVWYAYNTHVWVMAWFPLILLSTEKVLSGNHKWFIIGSLSLALSIYAGYPQIVIYQLIVIGLFVIYRSSGNFSKKWSKIFFMVSCGLLLASPLLIPGWVALKDSVREVDTIAITTTARFLPWQNLITAIAPDFFGNPSTYNYWGIPYYDNFAFFPGITVIILSLLSLRNIRSEKNIVFFSLIGIAGLALALPHPLSIFVNNLGLFGTNSIAARSLVMTAFALPILSAYGIDYLKQSKSKVNTHPVVFITLFLILLFLISPIIIPPEHVAVTKRNLILPFIVSISALSLLVTKQHPLFNKFSKKNLLSIALLLLASFELFRFGWKYISFTPERLVFPTTPTIEFFQDQLQPFRIEFAQVITENNWTPYGLESASGYDALGKRRYSEYIGAIGSHTSGTPVGRIGKIYNYETPLFDLLGIKYLLSLRFKKDWSISNEGEISSQFRTDKMYTVFQEGPVEIIENKNAFPRAFYVDQVIYEANPAETVKKMHEVNLKSVAIVNENLSNPTYSQGQVKWKLYKPGLEKLETTLQSPGFLVITDSFDSGWKTYVDQQPVKTILTNFAFQGIEVPEGTHTITRKYTPEHFGLSLILCGIGVALSLLCSFNKPSLNFISFLTKFKLQNRLAG